MIQNRLIEFLVYIVSYFIVFEFLIYIVFYFRGAFCKRSDGLLFNSTGVLTSFGVLTKVISIGKFMLSSNKYFFNCYLAAPRPTLGHCRRGSLTNLMLITALDP